MAKDLDEEGERIYLEREEELEEDYGGQIVAINVETGEIVGSGETLTSAAENTDEEPEGKIYFKRVGEEYTAKLM